MPTRPGPQPHNRIGTLQEQLRKVATPRRRPSRLERVEFRLLKLEQQLALLAGSGEA